MRIGKKVQGVSDARVPVSCLADPTGLAGRYTHVYISTRDLGGSAESISAILATSALAFAFVKYAGAFYLIYLGIGMIRSGKLPANCGSNHVDKSSAERARSRKENPSALPPVMLREST